MRSGESVVNGNLVALHHMRAAPTVEELKELPRDGLFDFAIRQDRYQVPRRANKDQLANIIRNH